MYDTNNKTLTLQLSSDSISISPYVTTNIKLNILHMKGIHNFYIKQN